ncbi:MAG: 5'-nucleotidase C-terminal domain-containing protein [Clostridia bacterium]|nr:5'-nucleotidase C-terminal domain-containing protein [Clostridia bacterium]
MRKTLSLVLAVLMVLGLFSAVKLSSASADSVAKTYTLVSSADDLTANGSYLVVSANTAGEAKALANQKSNNRGVADVTVTEDLTIVLTADQLAAAADDAKPFELALGGNATDGWSFYDSIGNGYLFAPCSVNSSNGKAYNYLRTQAENDDKGLFSVTIDAETYTIVSNGGDVETDAVYMRFNSSASCISCYTAGSSIQAPVYLYKLTSTTTSEDPDPEPEPEPEPEGTEMELVTELADGDEVVIFNPGSNVVMTAEDYLYNNSKHELKPAAATLTDGVLAVPEEAVVLTVELTVTKDIDAAKTYAFKTADEKYLYIDGTHVQLVERTDDNEEYTLFALDDLGDGNFYVKCLTAQFSGKDQYLQYFHDYFTVYSLNTSNPERYKMNFFAEPGEEPDEPIEEEEPVAIVLFTNDVHCGIRDGWGYAGVADLKKTLEAEGNEVFLVDAGDHVQGGPIGSLTQGEAIIDIMNFVGYDLATLGNHEFDYGMDQTFALVEQANYPYVSANFVKVDGNEPVLDAYKIFEANGKKIAFVGLSTPESITKSTPTYFMNEDNTAYVYGFCQDATGEGVYAAAQAAIDAARAEGADYVIIVGHMGIDEQSSPWMSTEIIANITGADAFIDGHSHSVINQVVEDKNVGGKGVLHGQTGTKLANVGKLTIDAEGGMTLEILPASEKVKDDPETDAYIKEIEDEFNELLNSVVAHTDHDLTINDPDTGARAVRKAETNLGDLCADAYRTMFDADIAFVNGGGVRANIPTGDITFQQIINVHPFGNTAVLAEVTGQQILDALEHGAASNPGESGGFLQVAGLKYEIHNYLPANEIIDDQKMWVSNAGLDEYRVKNVQVLNKETGEYEDLDLTKKYTLASHNYMLMDMGDGYAMFGANITILNDSGIADNKVLIDYIQSMPEVDGVHQVEGYTDPRGEGRITIVSQPAATIYGEDLLAADVVEEIDGEELYRYDVKIKNVDPETAVVGMQAFVEYDTEALEFVKATTELEGSTGVNEEDGVISFAWATDGDGITVEDESVIVSLHFRLLATPAEGDSIAFTFVPAANGATTGYSYVAEDTVIEATDVGLENGSITFVAPSELTIYGEDVMALDVMTVENGERLYRYDIRVKDLPNAGLSVNSAQIFVSVDEVLEFRKAEGLLDWQSAEKDGKLMFSWASDTAVLLNNEDIVLTLWFAAPNAKAGETAAVVFTTNVLDTASAMSFMYGNQLIELEAETIDGSITFADILLGDANCDGQVTAADAALVLRSIVGLNELSALGAFNADVDGDCEVTAEDAALILRYVVRLIDKFPAEEPLD